MHMVEMKNGILSIIHSDHLFNYLTVHLDNLGVPLLSSLLLLVLLALDMKVQETYIVLLEKVPCISARL